MSNKFCINCKHCKKDARQSNVETCYHPKLGYNLVTGEPKNSLCEIQRMGYDADKTDGSICGEEGLWFEAKDGPCAEVDNFHVLSYQRGILDAIAKLQQIISRKPYSSISDICKEIENLSIYVPWSNENER